MRKLLSSKPVRAEGIHEGYDRPCYGFNYKAKDGYYYNGFMGSPDCAEMFFKDALDKTIWKIALELFYDHGNGD